MPFITMTRLSYSTLVQAFFFNGKLQKLDDDDNPIPETEEEDGFNTYLQREHLHITEEDVWEALGRPRRVQNAPVYDQNTTSLRRAARIIYEDNTIPKFVSDIQKLSFHNRILHFIVCQTINPRQGSFSCVTHQDAWIMMKIIQERPPNLSDLVINKLKRTVRFNANDSARGLLYGKLFSELIDRKELEGLRDTVVIQDSKARFGPKTVKQTGFRFCRFLGRWVRIGEDPAAINDGDEGGVEVEWEEAPGDEDGEEMDAQPDGDEGGAEEGAEEGAEDAVVDAVEDDVEDAVEDAGEEGVEEGDEHQSEEMGDEDDMAVEDEVMEEDESPTVGPVEGESSEAKPNQATGSMLLTMASMQREVRSLGNTNQAMYRRIHNIEKTQYQILTTLRGIQTRVGIPLSPPPPPPADHEDV